ncbi:MAG: RNA polymerase sigma factor [Patescibacteria group bacterium]
MDSDPPDQQRKYKDEEILAFSIIKPSLFGLLVDRYQSAFLRTAANIVNNREDAEDIVQETFTKIYFNAGRFKEIEGKTFKSWAYKILINTSLTYYKKIQKNKDNLLEVKDFQMYLSAIPYEDNFSEKIDTKMIIEQALNKVPKHLEGTLRKYYLEDRSQKEIADEEKVSIAVIKMRLFRARKILKKILINNAVYA